MCRSGLEERHISVTIPIDSTRNASAALSRSESSWARRRYILAAIYTGNIFKAVEAGKLTDPSGSV